MIAVTGASGLLGSFVVRRLVESGEEVVSIKQQSSKTDILNDLAGRIQWREANVVDPVSLAEAFKEVDTVVHAAAFVSFNPRKSRAIFDINVNGTKNVVDTCLLHGIRKLIHVSSVAALGRVKGIIDVTEESKWVQASTTSDYAESKYLAELEVFRGYEEGLQVSIVNPSVILGTANWNRSSSQIFNYVWKEKPFYSEGRMNYVDVRDVAEMILKLTHGNFNGEKFIANSGNISMKELFEAIARRMGKKPPRIKVGPTLTSWVVAAEAVRSALLQREPMITRHAAASAKESFYFDNKKAMHQLQMKFRSLEETLDWCCPYYSQEDTINK